MYGLLLIAHLGVRLKFALKSPVQRRNASRPRVRYNLSANLLRCGGEF
jgi:hypothetical protein